ncbi:MAG: L,D-transpeptidase [Lachnospiraceae bacterium]|nr:L,D-transpeptidase [Lachnospiraceae bacterium]
MKEILLRKSISIAAAAAVLIALMIGTAACASDPSGSSEASSAASNIKPAATATAAPEAKDSKAAAEKAGKAEAEKAVKPAADKTDKAAAEAVTAGALIEEVHNSLANANYVVGNADFAFSAPVSADNESGADSISYMFESTRSPSIIHTSGTVNKEGASIGVESYFINNEESNKLLSCRDGKWTSQDNAYESLTVRNFDELTDLISLSDYTLNPDDQPGPSPAEYTLTTTLAGETLSGFLSRAGVFSEFPDSTLPESLTADVTLTVDNATKLPLNFTVTAPAGEDTYGFQYSMLFSSFDNSKTIFVPEEDIAKVIQMAEEKEKEEKEKKEGDDTTAGSSSSNTWVDVDLTNQIVTLYVDGVAIMSSPCVTGNILNGTDTPTGTYSISYKTTSTYLMNNSYVDYWMPFNGGIGLHDASWRGGNFASTEAWGNGSHGCVNLPHYAAETIYQYVSAGDTVVVHGWPQDPATIHSHDPGDWEIVKEATCKEEGKRVRKCKGCGETVEEGVIAKAGHTEGKWITTKAATEDAAGARELHCAVCDQVIKTEAIAKLNHTHTASGTWETIKNATCEAAGERVQRCTKDGAIVLSEAIPATGHSWSGWSTTAVATCTENGSQTRSCSVCGAAQTEVIPAAGHSWTGWTETAATCTENGSRTRSCSACGAAETETTDPAAGHSWGEVDSEGYQQCNICGERQFVGVPESEGSSSGSSE